MDKLLPHSEEAERTVTGCVALLGKEAMSRALAAGLDFPHFYDERYRLIFKAAFQLATENQPIDILTLRIALEKSGVTDKVDPAFLVGITEGVPNTLNIEAYANQIIEDYRQRKLRVSLDNALTAATSGNGAFEAALRDVQAAMIEAAAGGKRYRIIEASRALEPQPDIAWILKDFIARRWVSIWVGSPGAKKTWAAIDQAVSVAMGKPWLGFACSPVPVLIVDEESGELRSLRRLGDVMRAHEAPADIPLYIESLHGFNLTTDQGAAELEGLIEQVKPGLVIIDALADIMLGGDENSVEDTQPILVRLRRIAERQDCAIEVIHHVNKGGDYRGSSALKGAVDSMILIESRPDDSLVTFTAEKARDLIIHPFAASAYFDPGRFWLAPAEARGNKIELPRAQKYVLKFLASQPDHTAPVAKITAQADTCSPQSARQAVYSLATADVIERVDSGGRGEAASYKMKADFNDYNL